MKIKNVIKGVFICAVFSLIWCINPVFAKKEDSIKVLEITNKTIANPSAQNIEDYIETMKKRVLYHGFKQDYEAQADDCRSILYFLRKNKKSREYTKYNKKLNETYAKLGFEYTQNNRFEIAKNLYLEEKYFASAYEFLQLASEGYSEETCYEYLGDISLIFKNPDTALIFYKKALEIEPENYCITYKIANIYKDRKNYDLANEYYETTINLTEDKEIIDCIIKTYDEILAQDNSLSEKIYETLGLAYQKNGEYQKTYTLLKKAINLKPDDIFLQYYLANLLYDMKEYKKAIQIYSSILQNNPYETQIRIARAKCYIKTGNLNGAIKDYQVVLAIYPNSKQAQYGLYTLLWGKKNFDETIKMFYPLDKNFKPDASFYNTLANTIYQKGLVNDAIAIYKKSINISPKAEWAYIQLYNIFELEGKKAEAHKIANLGYKNIPNSKEIRKIYSDANKNTVSQKNSKALFYISNKEYEKAIKIYEQTEPKDAAIYESMANCYKAMKNYREAINYLKEATKLDPVNSDYYYNMALLYLDLNSKKTAQIFLEKAIGLDKRNLKARKLLSYLKQQEVDAKLDSAYGLFEKKDYKNALVELNAAENLYPDNPEVYYYKALTYKALNDSDNAYKFFNKTLDLDHSYYVSHFYMAQILENQGKEKAALEEYERFLGADTKDLKMVKQAQDKVIELGKKYY